MYHFFILLLPYLFFSEIKANQKVQKIKIAVIGAGPAGLSTTGYLAQHLNKFEITVFERAHEVGGQWLYTDSTDVDNYGYPVLSSVYKNLRTNTPKQLTNFPDWPYFDGPSNSYVTHEVVLDYLKNYTNHFQLKRFIQLNTIVLNISLIKNQGREQWKVTVKNLQTSEIWNSVFDAITVCSGIYSKPNIPKIPGLQNFRGQVLHSHLYRRPEVFKNKSVIVLGNGPSSTDMGQELLNFSSKVYISYHQHDYPMKGAIHVKTVVKFENGTFILSDNSSLKADVFLFCTGYEFSYPFLDESVGIKVDESKPRSYPYPLYKQLINVNHPSMSFIGVPRGRFGMFPFFSSQAQFIIALLEGKTKLPSKNEMMKDAILNRYKKYYTISEFWKQLEELRKMGGFPSVPYYYVRLANLELTHVYNHISDFKDFNLVLSPDKKIAKFVKIN